MYVGVCIVVHICMWVYTYVHVHVCKRVFMCTCIHEYLIACYSILDSFVRSELGNKRLKVVPVMDPIHRRFEDWSMGWSVDQYRFVSEDQTAIQFQNRVISCECLFLCHFLIYHFQYYIHVTCIFLCDYLMHFTSIITCITSWDINDCSPYLCSWYKYLSTSFHVL